MTPLEAALVDRIKAEGPISVEAWMDVCNAYYYATRDPLGLAGDFTTAPEVSQMYGELIGAALADCWARAGRPAGIRYAELGPGRGTLAADALRTMRAAGCEPVSIELVETSPVLRERQAAAVPGAIFHDSIAALGQSQGPLLLVASEFFDALPVRQFVGDYERRVEWIGGRFAFDRDGDIVERSPARVEAMTTLAGMLKSQGGAAILVDDGHDRPTAGGDTLQAVKGHAQALPLERPGEQDLTAHVDFAALGEAARAAGVQASRVVRQGTWLESLGIGPRTMALSGANPAEAEAIALDRRLL